MSVLHTRLSWPELHTHTLPVHMLVHMPVHMPVQSQSLWLLELHMQPVEHIVASVPSWSMRG